MLKIARTGGSSKDENKVLDEVCPMGVKVVDRDSFITDANCIHCGSCATAAPELFAQTLK
jgi:ferredoxin-like protein FixX